MNISFLLPTRNRPKELNYLRGDLQLARNILGRKPKYTFESMMDEMTEYWLQQLR